MLILLDLDIPWEEVDDSPFGIILECLTVFYAFIGLAIVCDEHLVPALDTLCHRWGIPEDVAGATFMAFGSAAPEIIIASVTTLQASTAPDPDAIALGVTSVVGSGLLAFSIIPALCGVFGGDPDATPEENAKGLPLNRRPLLRDHIAYLASLLMLMYTIADGIIHVWEAAVCLTIYICNLFVIIFGRPIRLSYLKNFHQSYYWRSLDRRNGENEDKHANLLEDENYTNGLTDPANNWGEPMYISFEKRPLGFKVTDGENNMEAIIEGVDNDNDQKLIGCQIMEINHRSCQDVHFNTITHWLTTMELPLTIVFQKPPHDLVENWTNARVKQWWLDALPAALHVYAGIVDECQLDGSDLFELDMEMLQEFGVKRIHGMKVLKAIDKLCGQQAMVGSEASRILKKLSAWEISDGTLGKLRHELVDRNHKLSIDGSVHSHGSGSSESEEHGIIYEYFEKAIYPMEMLLATTCPECELDSPGENWYAFTFMMAFIWVAVFSFCISSVIERWVEVSGMPMSFFGLLVVSIAAQTPDTLESIAVAKKGYGSMAVANCLGTQTINIGIGLACPWLITASSGTIIELEEELLVPCWIMIFLLLTNLLILFSDVIFRGANKVMLNRTRAYMMSITYCISIILYAIYLVMTDQW